MVLHEAYSYECVACVYNAGAKYNGRPYIIYNEFTARYDLLVLDSGFSDTHKEGRRITKEAVLTTETGDAGPEADADDGKRRRINAKTAPAALLPAPVEAVQKSAKAKPAKPTVDPKKPIAANVGTPAQWASARKVRSAILCATAEADNLLGLVQTDPSWMRLNSPTFLESLSKAKVHVDGIRDMGDFFKKFLMSKDFQRDVKKDCNVMDITTGLARITELEKMATGLDAECRRIKRVHSTLDQA